MSGNPILLNTGIFFLLYVLIVWLEFLLIAWPLLVDQPDAAPRRYALIAAVLTLRVPPANFWPGGTRGYPLCFVGLCCHSICSGLYSFRIFAGAALSILQARCCEFSSPYWRGSKSMLRAMKIMGTLR